MTSEQSAIATVVPDARDDQWRSRLSFGVLQSGGVPVGDKAESFHEHVYMEAVLGTDIPAVLGRHGLTIDDVTSEDVLRRRVDVPAPDICVDRIDYTLRDLRRFGRLTSLETQRAVDHLTYRNDSICFDSVDLATEFVAWYHYLVTELFMNPLELFAHDEFAEILRSAIEDRMLSLNDLIMLDDEAILEMLRNSPLAERFARLCTIRAVEVDPPDGVGRVVSGKARTIDPLVWQPDRGATARVNRPGLLGGS